MTTTATRQLAAGAFLAAIAAWPAVAMTPREKTLSEAHCPPKGPGPPCNRNAQSGYGLCVAPWARFTYDHKYKSYYVGGSRRPAVWAYRAKPEPRYPWEGTWGTDYALPFTSVSLWWTHGRIHQDGGGQYEPNEKNDPLLLNSTKR